MSAPCTGEVQPRVQPCVKGTELSSRLWLCPSPVCVFRETQVPLPEATSQFPLMSWMLAAWLLASQSGRSPPSPGVFRGKPALLGRTQSLAACWVPG